MRTPTRLGCAASLLLALATAHAAQAIESRLVTYARGISTSDQMGASVSSAGDVNGDGYADLIVGAPFADSSGVITGRAYVYFGGPGLDTGADVILRGEAASDSFGFSVSTAGDMNGDGFDDVIVGAPGNDAGGTSAGRAYVYLGGRTPNGTADLTLTGGIGDALGFSVSGGGDLNRDGFDDVVVGLPKSDITSADGGRAFVYLGASSLNSSVDVTVGGVAAGDQTGTSVAIVGDMNGDGFADLAVASPLDDVPGADAGRVDVFLGGSTVNGVTDLTLASATAGDQQGFSVAAAGDVNHDGFADLVVGSPFNDVGGVNAGRASVFLGSTTPDATADLAVNGAAASDQFGQSVAGAGDVNGDGFADVIVGAPFNDAAATNAGRAYLYLGSATPLDATADVLLSGEVTNDNHGASVRGAGDVDGDGLDDAIVGAPFNDKTGTDAGQAYVYSALLVHVVAPNGGERVQPGSTLIVRWLGRALADIALSTDAGVSWDTLERGRGGDESNAASIHLPDVTTRQALVRVSVTGSSLTIANADVSDRTFTIAGPAVVPPVVAISRTVRGAPFESLGRVAGAGDVNRDGYDDLIASAAGYGGTGEGQVRVYFWGPHPDAVPDLVFTGAASVDYVGWDANSAGDWNGDGYDDVMYSSITDSAGVTPGHVFIALGGAVPDTLEDYTLNGAAPGDAFGESIAPAGDVNGDGFDDIIIGASINGSGGAAAGRAYVYFGGPLLDLVPDITITGTAGDRLGISVAGAGDVNGDGYDDVIVGAPYSNVAANLGGEALVYFGGAAPDAVADWVILGVNATENMGSSVTGVGDVNGDGFDDILVGAPFTDQLVTNGGRAVLYFGGRTPDTVPDLTVFGAASSDFLGQGVGAAGDVNDDGFADFFVCAPASNVGAQDAGQARLYYGSPDVDDAPDLVFDGTSSFEQFGYPAGPAGDIDGDGFADFVIASSGNDDGGTSAGEFIVYTSKRYQLRSPVGGETWNVGASRTITWRGAQSADVWLSVDGGNTFTLQATHVGGADDNALAFRVPHAPTKFARVKITPSDPSTSGLAVSDSLFTIQSSIALLSLSAAPATAGGVQLTWTTDPGVGADGITGYRVYRVAPDAVPALLTPTLLTEGSYRDADGVPETTYRVAAVNGLAEEVVLGETSVRPLEPLAAWPVPYRGGALTVSYRALEDLAGPSRTRVALYDARGRLVRTLADAARPRGQYTTQWDGRDDAGRAVASGVFTLRLTSAGSDRTMRVLVLR